MSEKYPILFLQFSSISFLFIIPIMNASTKGRFFTYSTAFLHQFWDGPLLTLSSPQPPLTENVYFSNVSSRSDRHFCNIICINFLCYTETNVFFKKLKEGGDMAKVKKEKCAAKPTKGTTCKNTVSGKSKFCATHKKK